MSYFDPGWVRTSGDPVNPSVQFDYTAQGWQAERVPENASGDPNEELTMRWSYYNDGQLKTRNDQGGQPSTYTYDTNNNLKEALDAAGLTDVRRLRETVTVARDRVEDVCVDLPGQRKPGRGDRDPSTPSTLHSDIREFRESRREGLREFFDERGGDGLGLHLGLHLSELGEQLVYPDPDDSSDELYP